MLGGLLFAGLVLPALLAFALFKTALLSYFTVLEALGLSVALSFIYFSSTLLYVVVIGNNAIKNDEESLYAALSVTSLSFCINLVYSYFFGLTLADFVTALVLLYLFFLLCFIVAKVKETSS